MLIGALELFYDFPYVYIYIYVLGIIVTTDFHIFKMVKTTNQE